MFPQVRAKCPAKWHFLERGPHHLTCNDSGYTSSDLRKPHVRYVISVQFSRSQARIWLAAKPSGSGSRTFFSAPPPAASLAELTRHGTLCLTSCMNSDSAGPDAAETWRTTVALSNYWSTRLLAILRRKHIKFPEQVRRWIVQEEWLVRHTGEDGEPLYIQRADGTFERVRLID